MDIKITESNYSERLDKFLAGNNLLKLSRNQIQKLIKQGLISLNGLAVSPHHSLKTGDIVTIAKILFPDKKLINKKKLTESLPGHKIKIIHENDEFLVINKPAGLAVHGSSAYTLADWLIEKYPEIKRVGDDPERPGLVHRLDKDVNGLMVIAKTQVSYDSLKKQFKKRSVIKKYTALVYGKIIKDSAVINFPIKRASDGYKMAALPLTVKGQASLSGRSAETYFEIIKKFINYTLLKIIIKTGRTHQIRVHLSAYGNPLVGDDIYGTAKTRAQNKKLGLSRIFLIADYLAFTDLTGVRQDYRIGLTDKLKNMLKIVK